ncbi:CobQ/CobB/MinD/ParA nucleotide binding domain-containing protein [Thiohalospira halophila DSM 15071]|uniref:CobQ/CobB/MinD/ParA nucleotide binding domain-containing protein n=1 Tax=Thiohalospira halophila DSM 15071 TaxID=1123397 RepID=A0A1I1SBA2_9GAMM|nr:AAA family ATPase [Thiohalospira halophila]SFD43746.1 CobQ/CobB/MinD/ParA nucleotide binding domain-containing protein [Thiohalospira halophila DSM 15071]
MVRFHDALDIATEFAGERLGGHDAVYLIRDLVGRVSIAVNVSGEALADKATLSRELHARLGAFGPGPEEAVQSRDELLLPEEIFQSREAIALQEEPVLVYLVDRLMNNQDWLRRPLKEEAPLPTAVAFSLKGGVGRSTTFAAWAHHLAAQGHRVLAVDLDLEAPGLQSLLLRQIPEDPRRDRRPDYGVVDWLVEGRVGQADEDLFEDMLGSVELPSGTPGEIRVIPAFGKETRGYVAKLGRAYLPVMGSDGVERGFAEAILELLNAGRTRAEPFDVALLDARAGMHDIGAAAVTRLGAHAFLFARDDPQTWTAYEHLFEHLRWSPAVEYGMPDRDLRWRMSMVGAMAGGTERDFENLRDRSYAAWQLLYDEEQEPSPGTPEESDESMPHWPLPVYAAEELRGASFHDPDNGPAPVVLEGAYRDFFDRAGSRLLGNSGSDE